MRQRLIFGMFFFGFSFAFGQQELSLTTAYELAEKNYPLIQNRPLFSEINRIQIENISSSELPVINWKTEATIQSEVP